MDLSGKVTVCLLQEKIYYMFDLIEETDKEAYCPGCEKGDNKQHIGIYCKVMDWQKKRAIRFIDLTEGK